MKKIILILLVSTSTLFFTGFQISFALDCGQTNLSTKDALQCGQCNASGVNCGQKTPDQAANDLGDTAKSVINFLSAAVGVIAVAMMMVGGLRYVTSAGNEQGVKGARNTILYALVGLVIVAFAQIMVHFVLNKTQKATTSTTSSTPAPSAPTTPSPQNPSKPF